MKSLWINLILIATLAGACSHFTLAQSPEQVFQKGLMKEEGEGALQDAISLYSQVSDNSDADPSIRAKALLHIGMCYEKMGTQEAVKAYQRLVNNFPAQKNEVAIARKRLNSLLLVAEKVPVTPPALKFTKLEIPTKPGNGVLSPDGKKLAYIADNALWSVPVQGRTKTGIAGEPVRLTESMEVWNLANMCAVWSANGKWLVFYVTENREDVIYIVSADGGKPVKVPLNQQRPDIGGYDYRMSLSPDGKLLAFVNCDKNNMPSVYTVPTDGGSPIRLTGSGFREPSFSPDGRFIAIVKKDIKSSLGDEIYVIPATGGDPILISDDAGAVKSPVWSPDGSMIAFLATKYDAGYSNASNELWIAAVDRNGKPTGLITKTDLSNSTLSMLAGWSPDNKIGIWLSTPFKTLLYTVPAEGGQAMQITAKNSWEPCWSPDGKYLYFDGINTDKWASLESVPATGGEVLRSPIRSKYRLQPGCPTGGISISPDGERIVFSGYYYDIDEPDIREKLKGGHIMTIPVKGGTPVELTSNPLSDMYPVWAPDGKNIAFSRCENKTVNNKTETIWNIYTIPAAGGTPKKVTSIDDTVTYGRIDWSPDGRWIGYYSHDYTIKMIPAGGGNSKVVVKDVEPHPHLGLSFSPDGDKIAYCNKEKLYVADLNTGNKEEIRTGLDAIPTMPAWSPDGSKIAFCAYDEGETDLWFMENFLPLEKLPQIEEQKELLIRKILADTEIEPLGTPSPDGRYISYTDWNSDGNLGILDLETKEKKLLTDFRDPNEQVYYSSWSPDGKQIAYFWWIYDKDQYNLSVADIQKAESVDLLISDKYGWIELGNWSSDGKCVFAILSLSEEPKSQLVRFSVADGKMKVLKTFEEPCPEGKPYVSPDNRFVAFDLPDRNASGNSDIILLSLENGQEGRLLKHPAHDYILGWTPDGKHLLFATDRSGTVDAMLIAVEDGKPAGNPKPVKQNIGPIVPMGFTQDGSFYYGQWPSAWNIYSAEIDINEAKLLSEPTPLVKRFEGRNGVLAYSTDGKHLAYISQRGVLNRGEAGLVLCIRNLETGQEKEIIPDPEIWGEIRSPQWSPDNLSIALSCKNQDGYSRIYKYDTQATKFTPLITESEGQPSNIEYAYPIWSKDGKSLFYLQFSRYSTTSQIMARDIETGEDRELYSYSSDDFIDRLFRISISPDGKWLAAINRGENRIVRLISTYSGEIRELYKFKAEGGSPYSSVWSKDGKYIIFPYQEEQSSDLPREWNLMRVAVDGGEDLSIEMNNIQGIFSPSLHPDGKTLAFTSAGYTLPENNIWEMKYFLPSEKEPESMAAKEPEGIRIRQIKKHEYLDDPGTVSADGRSLAYVFWGEGDVAIYDLVTGEDRVLTHEAYLGESEHFAQSPVISRDGSKIACYWWNPHHTFDLQLIDVGNSSSSLLYREEGIEVYPVSWISDQELIAIRQNRNTEKTTITSFNISDGTHRDLKQFDGRRWFQLSSSPDGKYLAYNFIYEPIEGNPDIHVLPVSGGSEISMVTHPAKDHGLGWVPGQDLFLFTSDRSGTWDLWAVPVKEGKPAGPEKRIYTNIGDVSPMGFTDNGDCFVGFTHRNFNAYLAPFNSGTGEVDPGSGTPLSGSNFCMEWSPDGQSLAYVKESVNSLDLTVRDLKTGTERQLADNFRFCEFPRWSPDGKSILFFGFEKEKYRTEGYKGGMFLADAETGKAEMVFLLSDYTYNPRHDDRIPLSLHEWAPDGKSFYYLIFTDRLVKHDLETGKDHVLFEHTAFKPYALDLSPDGKQLLFGLEFPGEEKGCLYTIPAEGGKEKEVCTFQESNHFETAFWSPDCNFIYFVEKPEETNLWRVPADGGEPEKVWSSDNNVNIFDIHPDGNQVAFSIRERATEVRVIENLAAELDKVFNSDE